MPVLSHRFLDHERDPGTQILIVGTFNPEGVQDGPDFFYGRPRNFLWQLLPVAYGHPSLKTAALTDKLCWMREQRIDFIDLIAEVDVPADTETNVEDIFIDDKVTAWQSVTATMDALPKLTAVFFTRKTFARIPNITAHIREVRDHALRRGLHFACLETPARYANARKQAAWEAKLILREPCQSL